MGEKADFATRFAKDFIAKSLWAKSSFGTGCGRETDAGAAGLCWLNIRSIP
jgi:hypothetical protein